MIRRGTYQASPEDSRWAHEPESDLWPYIDTDSNSSNYGSDDEGIKDQENPYYQEQKEAVFFPSRNPRITRQGNQRALIKLKSDIEISKDKLFFIKHMSDGPTRTKCYLV